MLSFSSIGLQVPDLKAKAQSLFGANAVATVIAWEELIAGAKGMDTQQRLKAANDFFNQQVTWTPDIQAWKQEDYWATPLETMGRQIGDCEDFSISKYMTLVLMGVKASELRMVYVKATRSGITQAHMVLAWYKTPGAEPLILDNMESSVMRASQRGDLKPVFSFNGDAIWVAGKKGPSKADPMARLSRWKQVVEKMRDDGFAQVI